MTVKYTYRLFEPCREDDHDMCMGYSHGEDTYCACDCHGFDYSDDERDEWETDEP